MERPVWSERVCGCGVAASHRHRTCINRAILATLLIGISFAEAILLLSLVVLLFDPMPIATRVRATIPGQPTQLDQVCAAGFIAKNASAALGPTSPAPGAVYIPPKPVYSSNDAALFLSLGSGGELAARVCNGTVPFRCEPRGKTGCTDYFVMNATTPDECKCGSIKFWEMCPEYTVVINPIANWTHIPVVMKNRHSTMDPSAQLGLMRQYAYWLWVDLVALAAVAGFWFLIAPWFILGTPTGGCSRNCVFRSCAATSACNCEDLRDTQVAHIATAAPVPGGPDEDEVAKTKQHPKKAAAARGILVYFALPLATFTLVVAGSAFYLMSGFTALAESFDLEVANTGLVVASLVIAIVGGAGVVGAVLLVEFMVCSGCRAQPFRPVEDADEWVARGDDAVGNNKISVVVAATTAKAKRKRNEHVHCHIPVSNPLQVPLF